MSRMKRNDKRERLVQAADQLFYEQTFHATTLADIAKLADVPLGNVYYYFKTKEAIMAAVLKHRASLQHNLIESWNQESTPRARLEKMLSYFSTQAETFARFGHASGSLSQELAKNPANSMATGAAKILQDLVNWVQAQFEAMGHTDAEGLAEHWVGNLQGATLLTLTFKQPELLAKQSKTLADSLATA